MAYTYDERLFSDLHKDAYGVRPGECAWAEWQAASPQGKQAQWDHLVEVSRFEQELQLKAQAAAVVAFEAMVTRLLGMGAKTRAQAVQWLVQAEDCGADLGYVEYSNNLPYGYLRKAAA